MPYAPAQPAFVAALLACALAAPACGPEEQVSLAPQFDIGRAWSDLEKQVGFGPRPAGSAELETCRQYLESELRAVGLAPRREAFGEATPSGPIDFVNVFADFEPKDPNARWVLLCSHYDTKRMKERFVGANDAGSSTAVLLEVARVVAKNGPRAFGYRFLFVDGEEALRDQWVNPDNRYGSRHHASGLKQRGEVERYVAAVGIDMVGDKELKLFRDINSDARLLETFFSAARANGLAKYVDGPRQEVLDDHLSFRDVGIRSIDLIDLEFGPHNSWWHTTKDTLENCSKDSVHAAGKIVLLGIEELERQQVRSGPK